MLCSYKIIAKDCLKIVAGTRLPNSASSLPVLGLAQFAKLVLPPIASLENMTSFEGDDISRSLVSGLVLSTSARPNWII